MTFSLITVTWLSFLNTHKVFTTIFLLCPLDLLLSNWIKTDAFIVAISAIPLQV